MVNEEKHCLIWGTPVKHIELTPDKMNVIVEGSQRTGGDYEITDQVHSQVAILDEKNKAKLTTILLDLRQQGQQRPVVTYDLVEKAKRADRLSLQMRAERFLQYLAKIGEHVGQEFWIPSFARDMEALAWSESTEGNESEMNFLADHLATKGWLRGRRGDYKITVEGYEHVKQQGKKKNLSQCFVAMWLDDSMKQVYNEGIEKAIMECGYTSMKIDEKQHLNKICDEAIAEIRRSRFVVADFTHGAAGARGSVYYEAGFAQALDLPVIFSCRKDQELHFDTRQYPHILWETPEDLYTQLRNKIGRIFGDYKAEPAPL